MIVSQAKYFLDQGHAVTVCCQKLSRGGHAALSGVPYKSMSKPARLLLTTGMRNRLYVERVSRLRRSNGGLLVDHGQFFADADMSYVHNFLAPQYSSRIPGYLTDQNFPRSIKRGETVLVANSHMVRQALLEQFKFPDSKVVVEYPGHNAGRFSPDLRHERRAKLRKKLRIEDEQPVVGLVTSGHFEKRGLDRFLDCVSELRTQQPGLRALILGGKHPPGTLHAHHLYKSGLVLYRKSSFVPEDFFAALDLFLYPARYEEFGIVVLEAMAMGIPVVTSTAVGASELLATASDQLVITAAGDDVASYCQRATDILGLSETDKKTLSSALCRVAKDHTHTAHNRRIHSYINRL